jgi:hypothetical protein
MTLTDNLKQEKSEQNTPEITPEPLNSDQQESIDREMEFDEKVNKARIKQKTPQEEIEDIENEVVKDLNQKHAVVHTDQFYILTEKPHTIFAGTDFVLESRQSFLNTYENQIPEGHSKSKAKIWLSHENRRQFNGITFDPTATGHKKGFYNIWKGFSVTPNKGNCELFKSHVETVICEGIKEYSRYLWKWIAHLIQKPDEIATGIVLMGSQGTGKGKFVKTLGKLLGQHFIHLDNLDRLLGNFNFHMKNAVLVFGDEAIWGGNKKDIGKLKAMVTEEYAMIEPKGKDPIPVRNFRHFIFSSNEKWPIHLDPDDRRFLVLKVSNKHKEDYPYFKEIDKELNNGGFEALLYELLNEDLTDFNPRELPLNVEAFHVKMQSSSSEEQYIYNVLREGTFDIGNNTPNLEWGERILTTSTYNDYTCWCYKQQIQTTKIVKNNVFGSTLFELIPSIDKKRPAATTTFGQRPEYYYLPTLEKARRDFEKSFKVNSTIWE